MLNSYICCLDIGSSKIACALAKIKRGRINTIFFESMPAKGIKRGVVVDSIGLVGIISRLLKNLKNKSGMNIKYIYTNISGQDIFTKHSRAIVPLAERGNKVITALDIQKVNEQARILGSSLEDEIIRFIPSSFSIDTKSNIINPLGLYSHKLEVDLYLVCVKLSSLQSLARVINQSGYEIKELFFSGLATSKVVFDKELERGLNLFCDIGSDTIELLVFKDGILKDLEILPVGGDDLTNGIAAELKIPFDLAEDIKRSYGAIGDAGEIGEDREILVKKSTLYIPIKQKLVSEIITQAAKSICAKIKEAAEKKVASYEVNNFIIAGRTVLLEGFIETLENSLGLPVKLGRITNPGISACLKEDSAVSGQKYLMYLTCLGMISEALQEKSVGTQPLNKSAKNIFARAVNRFKEVYQEYF